MLAVLQHEYEHAGDYSAAAQALQLMVSHRLTEEQVCDATLVRAKVRRALETVYFR